MNKFQKDRMSNALKNTFPENPDIITLWNSTKKLLELVEAIDRQEVKIVDKNLREGEWDFTHGIWVPQ